MSSLIRRKNFAPRGITRDEFLTPFDRVFDDMFSNMFPTFSRDFGEDFFVKGSYPKVNVVNREGSIDIEAAIPGMNKDDVTVEITEGTLTIQGHSNQHEDIDDAQYVRREIKRSAFQRSFKLGENLNHNSITAKYDNGILTLNIPKITPDDTKPATQRIEIL